MEYQCASCGHQQEGPDLGSFCPQCGKTWSPVVDDANAEPQVNELPLGPSETIDNSKVADSNSDLEAERIDYGSTYREASIRLEYDPMSLVGADDGVVVNLRLTGLTNSSQSHTVWLDDRSGRVSAPEVLNLEPLTPTTHVFFWPHGRAASISVRVDENIHDDLFWEATFTTSSIRQGPSAIHIHKEVGGDYFGGIEEVGNQIGSSTNWVPIALKLKGPKQPAHHRDIRRSSFHDQMFLRPTPKADVTTKTARMTLQQVGLGQPQFIQIFAGDVFHLGRANTHAGGPSQPNDIVLRTHQDDHEDRYISRYHGTIAFKTDGVVYTNLSSGGTVVSEREVGPNETTLLNQKDRIQPGRQRLPDDVDPLTLEFRRYPTETLSSAYQLLLESNDRTLETSAPIGPYGAVSLRRLDALDEFERYILCQQSFLIGSDKDCAWTIEDDSIHFTHALMVFLDGSFWIERYSEDCDVRVNGNQISKDRLKRLNGRDTVQIGKLRYRVLPRFEQHLVHNDYFPRHG